MLSILPRDRASALTSIAATEKKTKSGRRRQSALKRAGATHVGFPCHKALRVRHAGASAETVFLFLFANHVYLRDQPYRSLALLRHYLAQSDPDTFWRHLNYIQIPGRRSERRAVGTMMLKRRNEVRPRCARPLVCQGACGRIRCQRCVASCVQPPSRLFCTQSFPGHAERGRSDANTAEALLKLL